MDEEVNATRWLAIAGCVGLVQRGKVRMKRTGIIRVAMTLLMTSSTGIAWAGPFDNAVGTWWGQAEYVSKVNAVLDEAAQAVGDLTIRVEPGGKVSGASPANGCQLSGVLTPFTLPQVHRSQITVSGCRAASLNGRYLGTVAVTPKSGTLALSLTMSQPGGLGRDSKWGTITVTMVRG